MNNAAREKIKMLKGSIRCLVFGLLGLLPFIGLPFGLAALWVSGEVRVKEKIFWNAAKPYRIWGVVCAAVGMVFWSFILMLVIFHIAGQGGSGGISSLSGDE
jgi:hypothetical protein